MSSNNSLEGIDLNNTSSTSTAEGIPSSSSETEIEDIMWTLLARAGLISKFKGEIAKCLQENSGDTISDFSKIQARADPTILQSIYEYLQWVGMKHTSAFLLSESSLIFNTPTTEDNVEPKLCHLFRHSGSADASLAFDEEQFASPVATHRKSEPGLASISIGNKTYTAGPVPLQRDESNEIPSFRRSQNASASLSGSSLYFTPDTGGSPSYLAMKDRAAADKTKDNLHPDIVRVPGIQSDTGTQPGNKSATTRGDGDFHELKEQLKSLTVTVSTDRDREEESKSNISLKSLQSEPVDSRSPPPYREPSRLRSDDSVSTSQDRLDLSLKDENANVDEGTSNSPTFLSPSSSTSEQVGKSHESRSQHQESKQESRQFHPDGKEEDTLDDESMSDVLSSVPDNNTQDVSLAAGATSDGDTDSKELESCDHVIHL